MTILLGVLPDQVRKDVIASRKVSCLGILFRLYTIFQPGGSAERTALLKSITDLKVGHGVADVLSGSRQWRRWIQRARELGLATPDPLVLVQVLNRVTEALGRQGGAQVSFRMAAARQDLAVVRKIQFRWQNSTWMNGADMSGCSMCHSGAAAVLASKRWGCNTLIEDQRQHQQPSPWRLTSWVRSPTARI